eukprot:2296025-Rhodomonas_salina.3
MKGWYAGVVTEVGLTYKGQKDFIKVLFMNESEPRFVNKEHVFYQNIDLGTGKLAFDWGKLKRC